MERNLIINNEEFKVPKYLRILDKLMMPLMFVLWWFKSDAVQETHSWHCQIIDWTHIDTELCVEVINDSKSWVKWVWGGLNHMPIFWWWRDYIVLEVIHNSSQWFVGWKSKDWRFCQLHKLPINWKFIKMLKGSNWKSIYFFWIDEKGNQIPIKLIDSWRLWDKKYLGLRLF